MRSCLRLRSWERMITMKERKRPWSLTMRRLQARSPIPRRLSLNLMGRGSGRYSRLGYLLRRRWSEAGVSACWFWGAVIISKLNIKYAFHESFLTSCFKIQLLPEMCIEKANSGSNSVALPRLEVSKHLGSYWPRSPFCLADNLIAKRLRM